MWKEEIDRIMKDDELHDISYQLKDGRICWYNVRGIRYPSRYGNNFIDVYCSCPDFKNSLWDWRTFKICSIKTIDGKTYEETIEYKLRQERFIEQKKEEKLHSNKNSHEAGCAIAGGLSMLGFIMGGALLGSTGAIICFVLGNVIGFYIGNEIDKK